MNNDNLKEHAFIPIGYAVTVKGADGAPCTHGAVTGHNDDVYSGWSYKMHIQKWVE